MKLTSPVILAALFAAACSPPASTPASTGEKAPPAAAAPAATPAATPATPAATPAATSAGAQPATAAPVSSTASAAASAGTPPPAAPAPPTAPAPPPAPTHREITIPAETTLTITLTTPIASDTSKVEDPVNGTLARPIVVDGDTAVPAGAQVTGSVLEAKPSGRVKGLASIAFRFDRLAAGGERHQIQTNRISREATADRKGDVKKGGLGAGAGALIGGIAGGGKGAAIGSVIGGAGTVMATKGKEVRLGAGDTVSTKLRAPVKILVPIEK